MYTPPFTLSAKAVNLIAEISAQIERYAIRLEQSDGLLLRKANRIKTIHSSLAIEGNTLTEGQVVDIIDGKTIVAPIREIQEVKNAIRTYELYPSLDPWRHQPVWCLRRSTTSSNGSAAPKTTCWYVVASSITNSNSSIRSAMAMAVWVASGSHSSSVACIRSSLTCLSRIWSIAISRPTTMPSQRAPTVGIAVHSSTSCSVRF